MSASPSNVRVVSNVFPVTTARASSVSDNIYGVCDDPVFRREVRGRDALIKLAEAKCGVTNNETHLREKLRDEGLVEEWQITVFWRKQGDGRCVDCPPGERPIGIVRGPGGKCSVVNRCEQPRCRCRPESRPI